MTVHAWVSGVPAEIVWADTDVALAAVDRAAALVAENERMRGEIADEIALLVGQLARANRLRRAANKRLRKAGA